MSTSWSNTPPPCHGSDTSRRPTSGTGRFRRRQASVEGVNVDDIIARWMAAGGRTDAGARHSDRRAGAGDRRQNDLRRGGARRASRDDAPGQHTEQQRDAADIGAEQFREERDRLGARRVLDRDDRAVTGPAGAVRVKALVGLLPRPGVGFAAEGGYAARCCHVVLDAGVLGQCQ